MAARTDKKNNENEEEKKQTAAENGGQLIELLQTRMFQVAISLFLFPLLSTAFQKEMFDVKKLKGIEIDITKVVKACNEFFADAKCEAISPKVFGAVTLNIFSPNAQIELKDGKHMLLLSETDVGVFFEGATTYYKYRKGELEALGLKEKVRVRNPFEV